jgi:glutamate racemase
MFNTNPIGVFDSGLGGVNVLAALRRNLPNENYIFYGDTANNPYGNKPVERVRELTLNGVRYLLSKEAKAIVIACNTATSAVIEELRRTLLIPVFGIEPAIKPAVTSLKDGKVLLMATPLTIAEKKLQNLLEQLPNRESVVPLACHRLAEAIEAGNDEDIKKILNDLMSRVDIGKITSVVLGCTNYPLAIDKISEALDKEVRFYDGSAGLARHVHRVLTERNDLNLSQNNESAENVRFIFTSDSTAKEKRAREILSVFRKCEFHQA